MIAYNKSLKRADKLFMMQTVLDTVLKAHGYDAYLKVHTPYYEFLMNFTPVKYKAYRREK